MWPQRRQPTRLLCPRDSPGKNTGVGCHSLLQCMKVKSKTEVTQSCPLATPWTGAYQAPPSMGFSRQEYWSGVPLRKSQTFRVLVSYRASANLMGSHWIPLSMSWSLLGLKASAVTHVPMPVFQSVKDREGRKGTSASPSLWKRSIHAAYSPSESKRP